MKPASFKYFRPQGVDECLELLAEHGDEAKLLAGGQSLVPMMNFRIVSPSVIIDINGIAALDFIDVDDGSEIRMGAMVRQRRLESDQTLGSLGSIFRDTVSHIGHFQIRNRGTIGGSIAHADPSAELPALIIAMDASLVVRSAHDERMIKSEDFFLGPLTTALEPDEIVSEIRFPTWPQSSGYSVMEVARQEGAFAIAGAIALITCTSDGTCQSARLAMFGVSDVPVSCREALHEVSGRRLRDADLKEIAQKAVRDLDLVTDIHASREFRRHLAGVLAYRSLKEAYSSALKKAQSYE